MTQEKNEQTIPIFRETEKRKGRYTQRCLYCRQRKKRWKKKGGSALNRGSMAQREIIPHMPLLDRERGKRKSEKLSPCGKPSEEHGRTVE